MIIANWVLGLLDCKGDIEESYQHKITTEELGSFEEYCRVIHTGLKI